MQKCIQSVKARQILDSRGFPTIEAEVTLYDGTTGRGTAPSGASTGAYEACELRDNIPEKFNGKSVLLAVGAVNTEINELLQNVNIFEQRKIDRMLAEKDGTKNKSRLGANAILAVSIACANTAAAALNIPLFRYFGGFLQPDTPIPMMNILNGGAHTSSSVDIQEFMIVPVGADSFAECVRWCCEVYYSLKSILKSRGLSVSVGDEGGFAPDLKKDEEALDLIMEAIHKAGYNTSEHFKIAIDAAASEWQQEGYYVLPKKGTHFSSHELIEYWKNLVKSYPIFSIEDALGEEDWESWQELTAAIGNNVLLVGDDLFVTNTSRLSEGIQKNCANAILIKPNQIGTLTETIDAILLARASNYRIIISHRSGETEDTTIASLAAGLNAGLIKTGAPCRSERTSKYNELLRIEEQIGQY